MKNPVRRVLALVLPLFVLSLAPAQDLQKQIDQFKADFRKAMELKDYDEMARLVDRNERVAIEVVVATCDAIAIQTSERLEKDIEGLRRAWKKANDSRFVDHLYEYVALMRPEVRDHRYTLVKEWRVLETQYWKAVNEKDQYRFPGLGVELAALAEAFETIGDDYHAARAWLFAALCYEEDQVGQDKADLPRAYELYGKYLAACDRIDLEDATYNTNKQRWEALEASGYAEEAPDSVPEAGADTDRGKEGKEGEQPGGKEGAAATPGGPIRVDMTFERMDDPYDIERPSYHADELFAMWNAIGFGERGTTGVFFTMTDSPKILRTGVSQLAVDTDGDGQGDGDTDVEIHVTGSVELTEVEIGSGDARRPWAFFSGVPDERRIYQGIPVNQSPQLEGMSLFVSNAATVVGELEGTSVQVIDDNMDGIYGSYPMAWQFFGLRAGNAQPQLDSMVIGGSRKAVPWSQFQEIGDQWYRLEVENAGMRLVAMPEDVRTGNLQLKTKGPKPDYLVVRGSGKWENCYFDLTEGGSRGLEVPAGAYSVYVGKISKGKRMQTMKALILPGESKPVTVKPGETATLELGAPFQFDFDYTTDGETVTVLGQSVIVRGVAGEVYDRVWNAVHHPEVSLKKKGSRKGGKGKDMPFIQEQTQIAGTQETWNLLWRPLDLTLETDKVAPDFEVSLYEKKNKLFGTIESDWK